jgi:hypothetical protein
VALLRLWVSERVLTPADGVFVCGLVQFRPWLPSLAGMAKRGQRSQLRSLRPAQLCKELSASLSSCVLLVCGRRPARPRGQADRSNRVCMTRCSCGGLRLERVGLDHAARDQAGRDGLELVTHKVELIAYFIHRNGAAGLHDLGHGVVIRVPKTASLHARRAPKRRVSASASGCALGRCAWSNDNCRARSFHSSLCDQGSAQKAAVPNLRETPEAAASPVANAPPLANGYALAAPIFESKLIWVLTAPDHRAPRIMGGAAR